ncbi:hypothetical protein EIP86_010239 [Pleurotus ostreatoroseus]|nr:hypothetical protein EIP86_010239 [Pleurotus ostreatoroseus]
MSFTRYELTFGFDTTTTKIYPDKIPQVYITEFVEEAGSAGLDKILRHVTGHVTVQIRTYVDNYVKELNKHYMREMQNIYQKIIEASQLRDCMGDVLLQMATKVNELEKATAAHKATLDQRIKIPDPPTFSGSNDKMKLDDWLNQIALYCFVFGMVNDH